MSGDIVWIGFKGDNNPLFLFRIFKYNKKVK